MSLEHLGNLPPETAYLAFPEQPLTQAIAALPPDEDDLLRPADTLLHHDPDATHFAQRRVAPDYDQAYREWRQQFPYRPSFILRPKVAAALCAVVAFGSLHTYNFMVDHSTDNPTISDTTLWPGEAPAVLEGGLESPPLAIIFPGINDSQGDTEPLNGERIALPLAAFLGVVPALWRRIKAAGGILADKPHTSTSINLKAEKQALAYVREQRKLPPLN